MAHNCENQVNYSYFANGKPPRHTSTASYRRIHCVRNQFFFFPWKSNVPVKRVFYHFSGFFHACKTLFTGTFFEIFTPSPNFSRGLFGIFSRVRFKISRVQNQNFSWEGYIFHEQNFRKEIKEAKNYNFDTHKYKKTAKKKGTLKNRVFSRAL